MWQPVMVPAVPPITGVLSAQLMPQMKALETVTPVNITAASRQDGQGGAILFDLGINIAGVARLRTYPPLPRGTVVTLSFGEIVDATTGVLANPFQQEDSYTYSGNEVTGSSWTPRFVYHGYRFIVASGLPASCIITATTAPCLLGVVYGTAMKKTGHLVFPGRDTYPAAGILQAIHSAVVQTQRSNVHSIPTDCPQREKRGWMGVS